MKEKKEFIEIDFNPFKQRIRKLDYKDPGRQDLDALIKGISNNITKKRKKR